MRASGTVSVRGRSYTFEPADSFAVLDWGRGVWTYSNTWYWGSASGEAEGVPFGFNLGYGFGDTSAASENALFYDGKLHKLSRVTFNIPRRAGRVRLPRPLDHHQPTTAARDGLQARPGPQRRHRREAPPSEQHQVFGLFTGTAVLDNGRRIKLRDFPGFAERVVNKW